ncbi:MAG: hypothetical protein ABIF71_05735 [Planctomycetota bacterium]
MDEVNKKPDDALGDAEARSNASDGAVDSDAELEASFKKALSEEAESRKVKGVVKFLNSNQLLDMIRNGVAQKSAEFQKRITAMESEHGAKLAHLELRLREIDELKAQLNDRDALARENAGLKQQLEASKSLFEVKRKYSRMLELMDGCESPAEIKNRIEMLVKENTAKSEEIVLLRTGLEFVGIVNPAPADRVGELIGKLDAQIDTIQKHVPASVFAQIKTDYAFSKLEWRDAVTRQDRLSQEMQSGQGSIACIAELIGAAGVSRGLYEKFKLLARIACG